MEWVKELGARAGTGGGWKDDFPLSHDLPDALAVDCTRLKLPIHPMLATRLRVFVDWHRQQGRQVTVTMPSDRFSRRVLAAMQIEPAESGSPSDEDAVIPVTRLQSFQEVEDVAKRTRELLEYQLTDVAALGQATFMAVAELCDNAIDHGENELGAYLCAWRMKEPRRQVSIAICDLGIGIPEHIRQRYPEWSEDGWAIAHAIEPHVTGTGNPHRGIGFAEVFESALTSSLHSAQMSIHSANGFCQVQMVQENRKVDVFPAARFRRGTWIAYDLVSV